MSSTGPMRLICPSSSLGQGPRKQGLGSPNHDAPEASRSRDLCVTFVVAAIPGFLEVRAKTRIWPPTTTQQPTELTRPMTEKRRTQSAMEKTMLISKEAHSRTADLALERRILNYLHQRLPNLSNIEVEAHLGTAVLRGTVPSRSIQYRCVDCCSHVAGVLNVIDRLMPRPESGNKSGCRNESEVETRQNSAAEGPATASSR
jgi:hypothetical protein